MVCQDHSLYLDCLQADAAMGGTSIQHSIYTSCMRAMVFVMCIDVHLVLSLECALMSCIAAFNQQIYSSPKIPEGPQGSCHHDSLLIGCPGVHGTGPHLELQATIIFGNHPPTVSFTTTPNGMQSPLTNVCKFANLFDLGRHADMSTSHSRIFLSDDATNADSALF